MRQLNPEQHEAIERLEGPLLVIAGPGSGKTRVITERMVHLIEKVAGLGPENILALTYTDKAAGEMRSRLSQSLPGLEKPPHISTFHSFCLRVLSERHFERRLLDQVDVWIFLRQRMELLGLNHYQKLAAPGAFLHDLNNFFSQCQDALIEPEDFAAFVAGIEKAFEQRTATLDPAERELEGREIEKLKEVAQVFRSSRRLIEEAGCSSFGSLISETVRLWDREPETLEAWRGRFRFVLVDEFQDTNYGQVELLRRLAAPPYNITAVGDDDQAIYRFRGAAHGAFTMFGDAFPGAKTVYLNRNYRSTKKILRAADVVIARNQHEVNKPRLTTDKDEGAPVFLLTSPDHLSEAAGVAGLVEDLAQKGRRFRDIAILYRAHGHRDLLVDEFRRRKIPFAVRGLSLLSTVILRDLIAYLRLVDSPHDNISLTRVLLAPRWRFPEELALEARRRAAKDRCSLYDALEVMSRSLFKHEVDETDWAKLRELLAGLRKMAPQMPLATLLDRLIERLGLRFLPDDNDDLYARAFRKFLENWEAKSETRKLREFMEYFDYYVEAGGKIEAPEAAHPPNAVQMMTVHAAKGLEFPVVFVLSVAARRFPHGQQKPLIEFPSELHKGPPPPENLHLQEERRLFYVAITRAQEQLFISSVCTANKKPSQFIGDLLSDAAVRARDIHESIQLPEVAEDRETPARAAHSPARQEQTGQGRLFQAETVVNSVHPPIAEWARQSPPIPTDGKLPLSATAIETYEDCPLKFKFSHYLKIPTGPQAALTFGNVMHQSVRRYFELRRQRLPGFDEMQEAYLRSWKSVGFEDTYQEETYKKTGLEQLREFVGRQNSVAVAAENIRAEENFKLELDDVLLEGRIDQINPMDPRRPGRVELVDYKTGRPKTQKEADKSLQLSVYALAAREHLRLEPERLTFYNLTNNEPVSTIRTEKDLDGVREKIREVAKEIRRMIFEPKPGFACKYCDYVPICPAHEGRF